MEITPFKYWGVRKNLQKWKVLKSADFHFAVHIFSAQKDLSKLIMILLYGRYSAYLIW